MRVVNATAAWKVRTGCKGPRLLRSWPDGFHAHAHVPRPRYVSRAWPPAPPPLAGAAREPTSEIWLHGTEGTLHLDVDDGVLSMALKSGTGQGKAGQGGAGRGLWQGRAGQGRAGRGGARLDRAGVHVEGKPWRDTCAARVAEPSCLRARGLPPQSPPPCSPLPGAPPPPPPPNHPHPPPPTTTTGRGRPHAAGGGASGASWVLACGARVRRSNQVGGQAEGFYVGGGAGSRSAGRGGRVRGEGCTGRGELEGEADVRRRSTLVVLLAQVEGPVEGRAGGLRVQCQ